MTGCVSDADDALQETLINARLGFARFDARSAVGSWLDRIRNQRLPERNQGP